MGKLAPFQMKCVISCAILHCILVGLGSVTQMGNIKYAEAFLQIQYYLSIKLLETLLINLVMSLTAHVLVPIFPIVFLAKAVCLLDINLLESYIQPSKFFKE